MHNITTRDKKIFVTDFTNELNFWYILLGYSFINGGTCLHKNGEGFPTYCYHDNINYQKDCQELCTSHISCVGFTFVVYNRCSLFISDSTCPPAFILETETNTAHSKYDLVAGSSFTNYVCYGKDPGKMNLKYISYICLIKYKKSLILLNLFPNKSYYFSVSCWLLGDGISLTQNEKFLGTATTREACKDMVKAREPSANGATYSTTGSKRCYAEFGMRNRNNDKNFESCIFEGIKVLYYLTISKISCIWGK